MKTACTILAGIGAVTLLCVMFILALIETILRGNKILDRGLDEDSP